MTAEKLLRRLGIDAATLSAFCRTWRISEMALFGSVLRDEFGPQSDVDCLVTFEPDAPWDLWDFAGERVPGTFCAKHPKGRSGKRFLAPFPPRLFGRKTDVVETSALRNPFFRREVLRTREVIYAA